MPGFIIAGRDLLQDDRLPRRDPPQVLEGGEQRAGEQVPALGRQLNDEGLGLMCPS